MRKILFVLLILCIVSQNSFARRCTRCGGSGKMIVFFGNLAEFGLKKNKKKCPICEQWIISGVEHRETCDRCGGAGDYETSGDRAIKSIRDGHVEEANEGLSYLSPAELSLFEAYKERLKGHKEKVPCMACNESGRCRQCNGSGYVYGMGCPVCSMTGICIACHGGGIARWEHVYPSEEEKNEILSEMASLLSKSVNRYYQNHAEDEVEENNYEEDAETADLTEDEINQEKAKKGIPHSSATEDSVAEDSIETSSNGSGDNPDDDFSLIPLLVYIAGILICLILCAIYFLKDINDNPYPKIESANDMSQALGAIKEWFFDKIHFNLWFIIRLLIIYHVAFLLYLIFDDKFNFIETLIFITCFLIAFYYNYSLFLFDETFYDIKKKWEDDELCEIKISELFEYITSLFTPLFIIIIGTVALYYLSKVLRFIVVNLSKEFTSVSWLNDVVIWLNENIFSILCSWSPFYSIFIVIFSFAFLCDIIFMGIIYVREKY